MDKLICSTRFHTIIKPLISNNLLNNHPNCHTNLFVFSKKFSTSSKKPFEDLDENAKKTLGIVYDKKPFKYHCLEGKAYFWCSCGYSHKQPFCDGTHKDPHLKIDLKPLRFDCKESKEYWFCNCKQTKHAPFCDGTHRQEKIQLGPSIIRDHNSPPLVIEKIKKK
ncbi:CDGSH iron-sulfur domain-containing protein 3 [Sarcoptes scabiei]|uniref:CDGSH iron-sulfur domain-containing protein 3, mitochondrial n=1 Tax=Sarcoptes scabiei TaxID=52283 RepID=A0A834RCD1_SARSC|nr:CDGSH iron-sulfur domain-containing protein 3 [Sarcoptes scabiei]